jgi:hypothetical protein
MSISRYPKKFLWSHLLEFFKGKQERNVTEYINILSKMEILNDPGLQMNTLIGIFAYRRVFVDELLKAESINISVAKLIIILEKLKMLETDTILGCLQQPS